MADAEVIQFPQRDADHRLLAKKQAAAMLHVAPRTLERMVFEGRIRPVKPSGNPRGKAFFRFRDLERLLEGEETG